MCNPSRCPEEGTGREVSSALSLIGMGSGRGASQRQPLLSLENQWHHSQK